MNFNSKGLAPIIMISLVLMITITAFFAMSNWYLDLISDIEAKKDQELGSAMDDFELLGIKNESGSYFLYLKSNTRGYLVIDFLELNGNVCDLPSSNVLVGKQINRIELDCSILAINKLLITSTTDTLIDGNVKLVS